MLSNLGLGQEKKTRRSKDFVKTFFSSFLGSGPDRGRSPVEWGDFPSVRSFVRTYVPPSGPSQPASQPASQPQASGMAGWASGLAGWPRGGTNGRTNVRTENLPILQDFVPYWGRCPKSTECPFQSFLLQRR